MVAVGVFGDCFAFRGTIQSADDSKNLFPGRGIAPESVRHPLPNLTTEWIKAKEEDWLCFCAKTLGDEGEMAIGKRMVKFANRPHAASGAVAELSWEKRTEITKKLPRGIFSVYFHEPYVAEKPANATNATGEIKEVKKVPPSLDNSGKIRCRHIILKHVGVKNATDNVRRRSITRSQDEAEKKMRETLLKILEDQSHFPKIAREISECQSCLKGGLDAGDLGWFRKGKMNKQFEAVAFALKIGQISDLVVSESGVHVIQRLA